MIIHNSNYYINYKIPWMECSSKAKLCSNVGAALRGCSKEGTARSPCSIRKAGKVPPPLGDRPLTLTLSLWGEEIGEGAKPALCGYTTMLKSVDNRGSLWYNHFRNHIIFIRSVCLLRKGKLREIGGRKAAVPKRKMAVKLFSGGWVTEGRHAGNYLAANQWFRF